MATELVSEKVSRETSRASSKSVADRELTCSGSSIRYTPVDRLRREDASRRSCVFRLFSKHFGNFAGPPKLSVSRETIRGPKRTPKFPLEPRDYSAKTL